MMEAFTLYSTLMRCATATYTILTAKGRSCDADPSGTMSLKLNLCRSMCWVDASYMQPLSFISGWRRPCMINQNAPHKYGWHQHLASVHCIGCMPVTFCHQHQILQHLLMDLGCQHLVRKCNQDLIFFNSLELHWEIII